MTTARHQTKCLVCGKDKVAYQCPGCLEEFCIEHLVEHQQQLKEQLDYVENDRNLFLQTLLDQISNPQKHSLIQQIHQWEESSIEKIEQTANEAKELVLKHTNEYMKKTETKLRKLTDEMRRIRDENNVSELNIDDLRRKLKELEEQLNQPENISIKIDSSSSSFINRICVIISSGEYFNEKERTEHCNSFRSIDVNKHLASAVN